MLHEADRVYFLIRIVGFVNLLDFTGATGPDEETGMEANSNVVLLAPVKKVKVKVVFEHRSIKNLVRFLCYLFALLVLGVFLLIHCLQI